MFWRQSRVFALGGSHHRRRQTRSLQILANESLIKMTLTDEELARLRAPRPKQTREERLEAALRYYAAADFLTTEQQQIAENALKR